MPRRKCAFVVAACLSFSAAAQAQVLLNYNGTSGATSSMPVSSGGTVTNYEADYQNAATTGTAIGATQPSSGTGTTLFASNTDLLTGVMGGGTVSNGNNYTNVDAYYPSGGSGNGAYSAFYDTNGTAGSNTSNPLALGTSQATPNTFGVGSGQTMTYTLDIDQNYHGISFISLLNPKATDAGSASPTGVSTTGMLGIAFTFDSESTSGAVHLQGQKAFGTGNFATASETVDNTTVSALTNMQKGHLVLNLTNNGNGTDTVSAAIYSLSNIGSSGSLVASLAPEVITLGTIAGDYDLDNSALGLEFGSSTGAYNSGNNYLYGNLTLSVVPEPSVSASLLGLAALAGLVGYRRRQLRVG